MLMKLMLLATAAAAVTATAAGMAANAADEASRRISRAPKSQPLPDNAPEKPESRAVYMNDPSARAYQMDYMYV